MSNRDDSSYSGSDTSFNFTLPDGQWKDTFDRIKDLSSPRVESKLHSSTPVRLILKSPKYRTRAQAKQYNVGSQFSDSSSVFHASDSLGSQNEKSNLTKSRVSIGTKLTLSNQDNYSLLSCNTPGIQELDEDLTSPEWNEDSKMSSIHANNIACPLNESVDDEQQLQQDSNKFDDVKNCAKVNESSSTSVIDTTNSVAVVNSSKMSCIAISITEESLPDVASDCKIIEASSPAIRFTLPKGKWRQSIINFRRTQMNRKVSTFRSVTDRRITIRCPQIPPTISESIHEISSDTSMSNNYTLNDSLKAIRSEIRQRLFKYSNVSDSSDIQATINNAVPVSNKVIITDKNVLTKESPNIQDCLDESPPLFVNKRRRKVTTRSTIIHKNDTPDRNVTLRRGSTKRKSDESNSPFHHNMVPRRNTQVVQFRKTIIHEISSDHSDVENYTTAAKSIALKEIDVESSDKSLPFRQQSPERHPLQFLPQNALERRSFDERSLLHAHFDSRKIVLSRCSQVEPIDFEDIYPPGSLNNCRKIGEGVYGEVFLRQEVAKDRTVVLKVIPIEGNLEVNGEPQKRFDQILSEVVIAMELSSLKHDSDNATTGFVELLNVHCVKGRYPDRLIELWELYEENKGTHNDNPEIFDDDQLYIVLELANAGEDLESFKFENAQQSHSAFVQVALTLAVAEEKLKFEHRDLHWGNILISNTKQKEFIYVLKGERYLVPTYGIKATIIDYTLSRIVYNGCCFFNDLSTDDELFSAGGDYQFDIYRYMKEHLENDWDRYAPYTNVLWLHYLVDKLIVDVHYKGKGRKHRSGIDAMMTIRDELLDYKSACDYAQSLKRNHQFITK